jgi:ABC-type polysaccharide/polyol phosphate export permease
VHLEGDMTTTRNNLEINNISPVYDSSAQGSRSLEELRELWRYRDLVLQMVRRDMVMRYKRSVLGIAWTMLNPLGTTIILAIVFSEVFGVGGGYAAYVLSGLMVWTFFAQTTSACMTNLLWGGHLLKRIYLPRTVFSVSAIGTGLINLTLSLVPLLAVMLFTGITPKVSAFLLPIAVLFLAMFSLGLGLLFATIAIRFADVVDMYQVLLTAWMYLSPVIYPKELIPEKYTWIVELNPVYYLIDFFRAFIYEGRFPALQEYLITGSIALVTLIIGWVVFCRNADELAYRL